MIIGVMYAIVFDRSGVVVAVVVWTALVLIAMMELLLWLYVITGADGTSACVDFFATPCVHWIDIFASWSSFVSAIMFSSRSCSPFASRWRILPALWKPSSLFYSWNCVCCDTAMQGFASGGKWCSLCRKPAFCSSCGHVPNQDEL